MLPVCFCERACADEECTSLCCIVYQWSWLWWHLISYAWPTGVSKMVISTAIDILRLLAWISACLISFSPCSPSLSLPPSFSPSSASSPLIYQIASMRSQLSPVGGSFLGWISVKWTHGIGRQSMTLSWDEREWEWWAPRHRCRVQGQKFMLQMHLRSMIISPVVKPHDS